MTGIGTMNYGYAQLSTPDLQDQIKNIIYTTFGLPIWGHSDPNMPKKCEDAAAQITALLKDDMDYLFDLIDNDEDFKLNGTSWKKLLKFTDRLREVGL